MPFLLARYARNMYMSYKNHPCFPPSEPFTIKCEKCHQNIACIFVSLSASA